MIFFLTTKIFLVEIFIIFLSILLIVFAYPVLVIFLLPCWIYKRLITNIVQKNPKFGNTLDGISAVIAGQQPYLNPDIVLIPYYTVADKLDIPKVVEVIKEKIIKPGLFPELKQKIVRKCGYHFWHNVDKFKVEDHVHYLKPDCPNMPLTRQELRELVSEKLPGLPFDTEKSPWEILIVPNLICDRDLEAKSVFIMRVNHCLMDGYALANFASTCADKPWMDKIGGGLLNRLPETNLSHLLYFNILLLFTGPYHVLKMVAFYWDKHEIVQIVHKPNFENKWNMQSTPAVSSVRLKAVKKAFDVGMSSLITALFAQALYKTIKRNNVSKVSKFIHGFIVFPLPGHPGTMTNHWSLVRIPVKVNLYDPSKTLKFVDKEHQNLRYSVRPLVYLTVNKLIAISPLWLRIDLNAVPPTSFALTNFPGPTEPSDIFGCRGKQVSSSAKGANGSVSMFGCFSFNGNFWFDSALPNCNVLNQEDAEYLSNEILETLTALEKQKRIN